MPVLGTVGIELQCRRGSVTVWDGRFGTLAWLDDLELVLWDSSVLNWRLTAAFPPPHLSVASCVRGEKEVRLLHPVHFWSPTGSNPASESGLAQENGTRHSPEGCGWMDGSSSNLHV